MLEDSPESRKISILGGSHACPQHTLTLLKVRLGADLKQRSRRSDLEQRPQMTPQPQLLREFLTLC